MHVSFSEYTQSLRLRAHPDSRLQIPLPTDNHQVCISGPDLSPSNCHLYISTEMSYRHLKPDVSKLSHRSSPRVLLPDFPLESSLTPFFSHPMSITNIFVGFSLATPTASLLHLVQATVPSFFSPAQAWLLPVARQWPSLSSSQDNPLDTEIRPLASSA